MTFTRVFPARLRRPAIAGVVLGVGVALAGCANNNDMSNMPGMGATTSPPASATAPATTQFNDADVTFAQMMIVHHRQAIEMSDVLLAKSVIDPEVRQLAEEIKAAQQPEIDTMTQWLEAWGRPTDGGMSGMDGMSGMEGGGMMTDQQMEQLEAAVGAQAQRLFLEGMIAHHKGAVAMAQAQVSNGKNPDAIKLAQSIIATQNAEIQTMQELLAKS